MEIRPREPVILATDFDALVTWYRDTLGFAVEKRFEDGFHYCNLRAPSGFRIGIASAEEMGVSPGDRRGNTVVLQLEVDDVREFLEPLADTGASVLSGPSLDKDAGFWFGSFADPEGNPFWVVDRHCP